MNDFNLEWGNKISVTCGGGGLGVRCGGGGGGGGGRTCRSHVGLVVLWFSLLFLKVGHTLDTLTVFLFEKIIASNRVYLGVILEYPNWFMLQ